MNTRVINQQTTSPVAYEGHQILDNAEYDQLMQQSKLILKKIQVFITDQSTQIAERKLDPVIFREICEVITLNHINFGNNISAIKQDIKYLFDNFSVNISEDGTHYGDNTNLKPVQFQKHIAKYKGGELFICNGQGEQKTAYYDGDTFIGPFVKGHRLGIIKFVSNDGNVWCISYQKSELRYGFGFLTCENNYSYTGDFVNDVISGRGTIKFTNGDIYEGDFEDNYQSGFGTKKYANGDVYTGHWKKDGKNGQGKMIKKSGVIQQGIWEDNILTKQQEQAKKGCMGM